MKLGKVFLVLGMSGMVLTFGLVLPQDVVAADAAGIQKLESYDKTASQGKKLNNNEVEDIVKIVRQDGKVDKDEYKYIKSILEYDNLNYNKVLSAEERKLFKTIYDDYANYSEDVTEKYPELVDLDIKLPRDLRLQIEDLVYTNIAIKEYLSGDEKLDADFKELANRELTYVRDLLKELQAILATSPYKTELTKIYNAETQLLNENLKLLSEK